MPRLHGAHRSRRAGAARARARRPCGRAAATRSKPYRRAARGHGASSRRRSMNGRARGSSPDEDVLRHVDARDDLRLLVDDADAGRAGVAWGGEVEGLAVHRQRARVRLVVAVEDLEQRRLAGAVLAQEREELAGPDVERDVGQGLHVGEGLGHATDSRARREGRLVGRRGGVRKRSRVMPADRGCARWEARARRPAGRRSAARPGSVGGMGATPLQFASEDSSNTSA